MQRIYARRRLSGSGIFAATNAQTAANAPITPAWTNGDAPPYVIATQPAHSAVMT